MKQSDQLRSQHDRNLFDLLLEDADVKRVNASLAQQREKGNLGVRRHLLSTSVRLSQYMAKDLHATASECQEKLQLDIPLELYVFPSPSFNAACVQPEDGRLFIMFSSSILEAFTAPEIKFVMGHELGHHLFQHHDIPIGHILRGSHRPNPKLALTLTRWSRYAEISADRAGAWCADNLTAVAHALFKLASGLSGSYADFTVQEFLSQVDEMQLEDSGPGQGAPTEDWFLTHPFSPLRVKALKLFHESDLIADGGISLNELDMGVESILSLMEPGYLEDKSDTAEAMRRLLFAGAVIIAQRNGGTSDAEIKAFESFFGSNTLTDKLDVERLQADLPDRIVQVRQLASIPQRMQVVRDLCAIAQADGESTETERSLLCDIAAGLNIPALFIEKALCADKELD